MPFEFVFPVAFGHPSASALRQMIASQTIGLGCGGKRRLFYPHRGFQATVVDRSQGCVCVYRVQMQCNLLSDFEQMG